MLNRLLLVACVLIDIAVLLYFFYWNRFTAWILGIVIRLVYWNAGASSLWLEIGAIQFSILNGRILLKDVHYHTSNQTIKIVKAQIAWRYWIRSPMMEEDIGIPVGEDENSTPRNPSCRIQITLHGLEWFLYNRTSAFDAILSHLRSSSAANRDNARERNVLRKSATSLSLAPSFLAGSLRSRTPQVVQRFAIWVRQQLPNLDPKELLPLGIVVNKGAIICGNSSTPSLLIAEFQSATGTFGVMRSRSKYDLYKQMLSLSFKHALVRMNENHNYQEAMTSTGEVINGYIDRQSGSSNATYSIFNKVWNRLKLYRLVRDYLNPKKSMHPKKRDKSRNDDIPIGMDFSTLEYAVERKILEAPLLELSYYVDVAGIVPSRPPSGANDPASSLDIGNGDVGPEWGVDLVIRGGTLRYGPWADRQRVELQRAFFPPTYQNPEPTVRLEPGDQRLWTALKVFIEFRDQVDLHIPFREASKNWQWDGLSEATHRPRKREPAYLHLTAGDRSSVSYLMPMIAGTDGYEPILEVHLDTITVTSSLNDIRLVSAETCRVHCELPSPLAWNAERVWSIAVSLRNPILFIIRDHVNMFTDLGKDWTSGPPTHYYRFVPMVYLFEFDMHHYELNLYANDQNIIDKPLMKEENAIFTLIGDRLKSQTTIPSNVFRPDSINITFTVDIPDASLNLSLPRWNTNALHSPAEGSSLAKIVSLSMDGSYLYYAEVREENVEQLKLNLMANTVVFKALGWSIRYFMILRDNLFGSFTHFSTLYEYLERRARGLTPGDPVLQKYREGKANMMQVEMFIQLQNGMIVLPAGLPGYEISHTSSESSTQCTTIGNCVILSFPGFQVQLRAHDHYMEMTLNIDTITGSIEPDYPEKVAFLPRRKNIFMLDGIDITANRLFGPAPRNLTYVCIWEIVLGRFKACLNASDALVLASAGNAFRVNFADILNAPAADYIPPLYPDLNFLKVALTSLDVVWKLGEAALHVSLPDGFTLDNNDLGGQEYRKLTSVRLPHLTAKAFLTQAESPVWLEAGSLSTDLHLDMYSLPYGWQKNAEAQAQFVEEQDRKTGRARRMFDLLREADAKHKGYQMHKSGVYLPQPSVSGFDRYYRRRQSKFNTQKDTATSFDDIIAEQSSESDQDFTLSKHLSGGDQFTATHFSRRRPAAVDDNEDMSSGDESDDEDLTERSDSDWGDSDYSQSSAPKSLARRYFLLTRHNVVDRGWNPVQWDDNSPFHCIRNSKLPPFLSSQTSRYSSQRHLYTSFPKALHDGGDDEHDTTIIRVTQRRATEATLTPLVIDVFSILEKDASNTNLTAELVIDKLMASYITQVSEELEMIHTKRTVLDIQLESVNVRTILHLPAPNPKVETSDFDAIPPNKFAILEAYLHGISVSGIISPESHSVTATLELAKLQLSPLLNTDHRVDILPDVLSFSLGDALVSLSNSHHKIECSTAFVQITRAAPEVLVLTGLATLDCVERVGAIGKRRGHHVARVHSIVHQIIQHSTSGDSVVDRLSTIQPSFLVQIGVPHELRINLTFRFLFHLRDCLFHLRGRKVAFETTQLEDDDDQRLLDALRARLVSLDPDTNPEPYLRKLASLFSLDGGPGVSQSISRTYSSSHVSVKVSQLRLAALDKTSPTPSELLLDDLVFAIRIRTFDFIDITRPVSMSQTSLRHKDNRFSQRISVSSCIGRTKLTVFPHLMNVAQETLRVQRLHRGLLPTSMKSPQNGEGTKRIDMVQVDFTCYFHDLLVQAVAEMLIFEFGFTDFQSVSMILSKAGRAQGTNHTFQLGCLFLRARSPHGPQHNEQDELASIVSSDLRVSLVTQEQSPGLDARVVAGIGDVRFIRFTVPRSALRLYHFFEEWRADFLPGIESMIHAMLSEVEKSASETPAPPEPSTSAQLKIQLHVAVNSAGIYLRVMHDTWVSWEVSDTVVHWNTPNASQNEAAQTFGTQISSQMFCIVSRSPDTHAETVMKLKLPSMFLSGQTESGCVNAIALMHYVEFKIKPSHWDTLLGVQQKFGQDFNDLVSLVQESRMKRPKFAESRKPTSVQQSQHFAVFLQMDGFRVGFEGLSSVLYLECPGIRGKFDTIPEQSWSVDVSDLALSLAPRTATGPRTTWFDRQRPSAFVVIDFQIIASSREEAEKGLTKNLKMSVTKIHAVMQPSSIGEIGDFVDEIQAEMLERKEQRAHELAAFKQKAQSILRTLEVDAEQKEQKKLISWLHQYVIEFNIHNVGVAFPLAHDHVVTFTPEKNRPLRAFLFSIKSVSFATQHGETGQATMNSFSFQFISSFKQHDPHSFSGESHETHNKLVYPEMKAHVRLSGSALSRQIFIRAMVSGFILELDSTIPEYVFSLFDVYREGKERMTKLSANLPQTVTAPEAPSERKQGELPTSNIFASLNFLSGKVRMYSTAATSRAKGFSGSWEPADSQILDMGAEIFDLPVVSVWAEYRGVPATQDAPSNRDSEPSVLMFKSTVHSSHNVLRPTLLPFLTELMSQVEHRMRVVHSPSLPSISSDKALSPPGAEGTSSGTRSPLQISFALRIDKSRLELTCHPDVNVVAGLTWESGGFVINASPDAHKVTFTGSVGGLSVGLKHGFLSEDCVRLDARNLAFSVSFAKTEVDQNSISSVSFALETEFFGGVRFSRLQDMLCFKAVWLDRIPMFNNVPLDYQEPSSEPRSRTITGSTNVAATTSSNTPKQEFVTVIIVRIRQINLDIDLGQSISAVNFNLSNTILRTKLTDRSNEVSFSVGGLKLSGRGNLSGEADVSNFVFQTIRRTHSRSPTLSNNRMLELRMTSGPLVIMLESDYQKLLHYRAEPLAVEILDDWSMTLPLSEEKDRPLSLSFTVSSPEVVAVATVGTIPKLMSYANKFQANLEAQREGASRESKTFRVSRTPKPDNPLSAVAEAMIHSARARFKEAEPSLSYVIRQDMSLRLDLLQLVVFPRNMNDAEVAQFVGREVRGHLSRLVESEASSAKRDIRLSFSTMKISRFTHLGHAAISVPGLIDGKKWLEDLMKDAQGADIVGLPSINMHMISEEMRHGGKRVLAYDFDSQFLRGQGMIHDEDIYITLNVGLYSWLTVLRKTLTREMEQVKATAEWRNIPSIVTIARKKPVDSVNLSPSKSTSLPPTTVSSSSQSPPVRDLEAIASESSKPAPTASNAEGSNTSAGNALLYQPGTRHIERLTMRQLGDATPDVMHPFFMKKAGFSLEDSLPVYVHEYATAPLEKIMEALLKLYSKQLLAGSEIDT